MRLLFWLLLAANCIAFAAGQGYLGEFGSEREPGRLATQLNPARIKLISASAALAPPPAPVVEKKPEPVACVEIGNFLVSDLKRFETEVATLALGDHQSRHNVSEVASHMVFIPPAPSKDAADKKAAELRQLGVTSFFVINDNSPLRWAISLGIFKSDQAAQYQLAMLTKKGVRGARVGTRSVVTNKLAFQFRDLSPDTKARLDKIKTGFPNQEMRACK